MPLTRRRTRVPGSRRQRVEQRQRLVDARLQAAEAEITMATLYPAAMARLRDALLDAEGGWPHRQVLEAALQVIAYHLGRPPMQLPAGTDGMDLFALVHAVLRRTPAIAEAATPAIGVEPVPYAPDSSST